MELLIELAAAKALRKKIPGKTAKEFIKRLEAIADDPFSGHRNVETIKGVKNGFRLRIGDWRAVYHVDVESQKIIVTDVKSRGDIYKRL